MARQACTIAGCVRLQTSKSARSMCEAHYKRWQAGAVVDGPIGLANGAALLTFEKLMLLDTDECIDWPHGTHRSGYGKMTINGKAALVHRVSLQRVTGSDGQGLEARHGPNCKRSCMNARAGHITWGTTQENSLDRHRDGTCTQAKLTPEQVYEIRQLADTRSLKQREIAERFGVSVSLIEYIKARTVWAHLPEREHSNG